MEEQPRTWTKEQREDIRKMKAMEELLHTPLFKQYQGLLNEKARDFQVQLMAPAGEIGDVLKTEYAKGAVFAFTIARDLPGVIMEGVRNSLGLKPDEEI